MAVKKKRRKSGKFTPLIWIVTGAALAFFIFYSGNLKNTNFLSKSNSSSVDSFNLTNFFLKSKKSEDIANNIQKADSNVNASETVKIFLARQDGGDITLTEKSQEIMKSSSLLKDSLTALINSRDKELLNLIPINTKINRIWIKNDIAYIDFSEEFSYNTYGVIGYKVQIYQIVYTATQFSQVKAVYFYMNGKPLDYLGGDGYPVNNPVYPYSSLPKFSTE